MARGPCLGKILAERNRRAEALPEARRLQVERTRGRWSHSRRACMPYGFFCMEAVSPQLNYAAIQGDIAMNLVPRAAQAEGKLAEALALFRAAADVPGGCWGRPKLRCKLEALEEQVPPATTSSLSCRPFSFIRMIYKK